MSYILDALKKSSQTRAQLGLAPAVEPPPTTSPNATPTHDPRRHRGIPWAIAAIALIWGTFAVLSTPDPAAGPGKDPAPPAPTPVSAPGQAPVPTGSPSPDAPPRPAATAKTPGVLADVAPAAPPATAQATTKPPPPAAPAASAGGGAAPRSDAAASDVQSQLGRLTISAHMYSVRPADRLVVIDNQTAREGDTLPSGVNVVEITPDGLLLRYRGQTLRRSVFN